MYRGTVRFFDPAKGWGFITPLDGSADVFVHIKDLRASGLQTLEEKQPVSFDAVPGQPGKFKAVDVRVEV